MLRWKRFDKVKDYLIVFCIGFVWDAILTLDILYTAQLRVIALMSTTFLITVISYLVWPKLYSIKDGIKKDMVFVLASGSAAGAGVTILFF